MSENWTGVRSGVPVAEEGKMDMWRGLFCALLVEGLGALRVWKEGWEWNGMEWEGEARFCRLRLGRLLTVLLPFCCVSCGVVVIRG